MQANINYSKKEKKRRRSRTEDISSRRRKNPRSRAKYPFAPAEFSIVSARPLQGNSPLLLWACEAKISKRGLIWSDSNLPSAGDAFAKTQPSMGATGHFNGRQILERLCGNLGRLTHGGPSKWPGRLPTPSHARLPYDDGAQPGCTPEASPIEPHQLAQRWIEAANYRATVAAPRSSP
jgi:hypothetical protein